MYVWMYGCMDAWMYGCMDGWMYGCMDVWMYGCMDAWMYGCMDVWMYGCMDGVKFRHFVTPPKRASRWPETTCFEPILAPSCGGVHGAG